MKNQKGITLIALVITIIVMLILVGVSVTVALNGGLFSTAQKATGDTKAERDNELALSEGKVTINGEEYNSIDEYVNGGSSNEPTEYTAYLIGQEVTVGGERFYVIADSDETKSTVTLLAKDNINTETLEQDVSANEIYFSETAYWSSDANENPYDLTEEGEPDETHYAAKAAYDYGFEKFGVTTGRLMTYNEATVLQTANSDILYGTNGKSSSSDLRYWLASAHPLYGVYGVMGHWSKIDVGTGSLLDCMYGMTTGVRPIIEITKDLVSSVS